MSNAYICVWLCGKEEWRGSGCAAASKLGQFHSLHIISVHIASVPGYVQCGCR